MTTVVDGLLVKQSTEFLSLCKLMGQDPDADTVTFDLNLDSRGMYFYTSAEFKAFCEKFGIYHDALTRRIIITVAEDQFPNVEHHYAMKVDL